MIKTTAALPLYNASPIAWLCLESLAAQQVDKSHEWELVIAEEETPRPFTKEAVMKYLPALGAAGCRRLRYIPLHTRVPLADKWRLLAEEASPSAQAFVMMEADNYTHPFRLQAAYDAICLRGADWHQARQGLFTIMPHGKMLHYRHTPRLLARIKTTIDIALDRHYLLSLPQSNELRNIANHLYNHCKQVKGGELLVDWDESENWQRGVNTHGWHNISDRRGQYFFAPRPIAPWKHTSLRLHNVLPDDIAFRLKDTPV